MVESFIYTQPVKIYFGAGKFSELAGILREFEAKRCVVVCGRHFAPKAEKLMAELNEVCAVFSGVEENPQLSGIEETVRLA